MRWLIHHIIFFLLIGNSFVVIAQNDSIHINYELSPKKGQHGKKGQQVPANKYYSGLTRISEEAQGQLLKQGDTLSILVWNVEFWPHYTEQETAIRAQDYQQINTLCNSPIETPPFDLILLQEVQLKDGKDSFAWIHPAYSLVHTSNYVVPQDSIRLGTAILAPYKINKVLHQQTGKRSFFGMGMTKSTTYAWIPIENKKEELLIVSVHGTNLANNNKFRQHMDQIFKQVQHHQGPILIAGDFNTWNTARRNYLQQMVKSFEIFLHNNEHYSGGQRLAWGKHFLDHVLIRGLELVDNISVGELDQPSDHASLTFQIVLKP